MGTVLVVGLLVMMCGGIAYSGDLLGRRMGKKRLTVFGLRPRHTAVVFTIVTGMVIASITLGTLVLLSSGVRIAVTRGEQLLYENHRLKQQRHRLDLVRRQLIAQREKLENTNKQLSDSNTALQSAQNDLLTEADRLQGHNRELQAKNQVLGKRNARLEGRNTFLVQGNQKLTSQNRALAAENTRLSRGNQHLAASNHQLVASNTDLKSRNRRLQLQRDGLERATTLAQVQLTNLHRDLGQTRDELALAQKQLLSAQRVLTDEQAQIHRGYDLSEGNVIVRRGEELARGVIPAGAPVEVVRATLRNLLDQANAEVARRVKSVSGRPRRVCLEPSSAPADELSERTVMALMTESHPVDGQIPAATGPMPEVHPLVVRALATRNGSDESADPVEVDIAGQVNHLAFRKGDEIAALDDVSTASTSGQLLKGLVAFLQRQVREAAVKRSILPDAAGRVGEIDYEELLDVVARVKRLPGRARIGAVAATEAWTAGPLQLDFYVVPTGTRVVKDKEAE